jgi:tetratricopeptide (TPR) repeat protein
MLVAFPLASDEKSLRASFGSAAELLYIDGKAWLPLQVSLIREGFLRAWQGGGKKWKDAELAGEEPQLIVVAEAWKTYPAVGLPAVDFRPAKPLEEYVTLAFDNVLTRFVAREIEPKVKKLLADFGRNPTPKQLNSLGILYARYGMLDEAKVQFQKSSSSGFAPAFTNLANVSFLQKDYETAARWFEEALKGAPTSKSAIIGLARARYELDAYAEADDLFGKVKAIDPALAARYSYLSSKVDGSTSRASSAAADRGGAMSWSEED